MANWSLPTLADLYANFRLYLSDRLDDAAKMFDSALTSPTNLPTGAKRWNSTGGKWEKWSGSAWSDMTTTYAISISGSSASCTGTSNYATTAGALNASNSYTVANLTVSGSVVIGSSGTYSAGSIYSDPNWGMLFRAKQASPTLGEFGWADAGGTELFRYAGGALTASISGNAATATAAYPSSPFSSSQGINGYTNSSGFGVRVSGRVSDNISLLQFVNNAQTAQYASIQGDATGHLNLNPASGSAYCNGSQMVTMANHPFGLGSDIGCTNVGSIVFARCANYAAPDQIMGGSELYPAGVVYAGTAHNYVLDSGGTLPGTWRCLGSVRMDLAPGFFGATLWQRIV